MFGLLGPRRARTQIKIGTRSGLRTLGTATLLICLCCFPSMCEAMRLPEVVTGPEVSSSVGDGRLFFSNDPDGGSHIIGSWFGFSSFTLALVFFGVSFLLACIVTATYYVLVVVTEPSQQHSRRMDISAIEHNDRWDWTRVLRAIHLAYQTYSTLDLDSMDCQSKILCEFQETPGVIGTTTRRLSNFFLYFNLFKKIPHIREYQAAVQRGQRRSDERNPGQPHEDEETCQTFYTGCPFSVNYFNQQYNEIFNTTIPYISKE